MTAEPSPTVPTALLHERLLGWYADARRDLPWRAPDATPWGVLVSEVMLQQTPVVRVEPVWHEWLTRWPAPADLAAAAPGDAVRAWGRLGYPRRALRLHAAAAAIVQRHDGRVPDTLEQLLDLPGVGSYTAAAVASFAYGRHATVVDTNIRRVHARAVSGRALPAPGLTRAETDLATRLLPAPAATAATWNVAVMELGALVCTARSPRCGDCPVADLCAWQRAGRPAYDGPRAAGRPGTAPTGSAAGRCCRCCGRPIDPSPPRPWPPPGSPTTASASAASTAWWPTAWWSRCRGAGSGCPATSDAPRFCLPLVPQVGVRGGRRGPRPRATAGGRSRSRANG